MHILLLVHTMINVVESDTSIFHDSYFMIFRKTMTLNYILFNNPFSYKNNPYLTIFYF